MRETVLDADGLPRIEAARDDDGHLRFYVAHRYPGGRVVLNPVPDEILRDVPPAPDEEIDVREHARQIGFGLARLIARGDAAREAQVEALEAQLSDVGDELADARRTAEEAEAGRAEAVAEAERLRDELEAALTATSAPTKTPPRKNSRAAAAA